MQGYTCPRCGKTAATFKDYVFSTRRTQLACPTCRTRVRFRQWPDHLGYFLLSTFIPIGGVAAVLVVEKLAKVVLREPPIMSLDAFAWTSGLLFLAGCALASVLIVLFMSRFARLLIDEA